MRPMEDEELPVRLVGRRENVGELLAAAELALLPSSWEQGRGPGHARSLR
ncbi:hypothetical protein [Streptomyces sp. NPDC093261]